MLLSRRARTNNDLAGAPFILLEYSGRTIGGVDDDKLLAAFSFTIFDVLEGLSCRDEQATPSRLLVVGLDRPVGEYERIVKYRGREPTQIQILDCFSDPYGWNADEKPFGETDVHRIHIADTARNKNLDIVKNAMRKHAFCPNEDMKETVVIFIDSVNSLLRYWDMSAVVEFVSSCRTLRFFGGEVWRESAIKAVGAVITTFRECSSASSYLPVLSDMSTTHLSVAQCHSGYLLSETGSKVDCGCVLRLNVMARKPSGRVTNDSIFANIESQSHVRVLDARNKFISQLPGTKETREAIVGHSDIISKLGLSFNVLLSEKEKEVRKGVALSYEHRDEGLANSALQADPQEFILGLEMGSDDDSQDAYGTDPEQDSDDDVDV